MKSYYQGKSILITGAAGGIGREMALILAQWNTHLFLFDVNEKNLKETASDCEKLGCRVSSFVCDLTNTERVKEAAASILNSNKMDVVIANAGVGGINPAPNFSEEIHQKIFAINVHGLVNTITPFIPHMIKRGCGQITGVSSLASLRGLPMGSSYSASKAAANTLLESWRVDLRKSGVKVTTVCPGFLKTAMTNHSEFDMPFMVPANKAAWRILKATSKGRSIYYFPLPMKILSLINRLLPNFLYDRIISLVNPPDPRRLPKIF